MRRVTLATIAAGVFGLVVACQPAKKAEKPAEAPAAAKPAEKPAAEADAGPAGEPGNIKITVAFDGKAPKATPINRKSDPYCAKTKVMDPSVMVNKNNTLANVAVMIDGKVRGKFEMPKEELTIDQKGCMYTPRVMTASVGQTVKISNSDKTLHNVHGYKGMNEQNWFNNAQPPNSPAITKALGDDAMVHLKCDVHPWMNTWIGISNHPFHGVTADTGDVTMTNVPSRAKPYKIKTWHEKYGMKEIEVTVEAGKTAEAKVTYSATDGQG